MSVLSAQQIEQFHDRGFVLLERGFGEPLAAEQRESIWRELCDGYGLDCLLGSWEALGRNTGEACCSPSRTPTHAMSCGRPGAGTTRSRLIAKAALLFGCSPSWRRCDPVGV